MEGEKEESGTLYAQLLYQSKRATPFYWDVSSATGSPHDQTMVLEAMHVGLLPYLCGLVPEAVLGVKCRHSASQHCMTIN